MQGTPLRHAALWAIAIGLAAACFAEQRRENFDRVPGWDGQNNRPVAGTLRTVVQDFRYSATDHHANGPGEVGGMITPDGLPAYYAKVIPALSYDDSFSASGTVVLVKGGGNTLLGFFNHDTVNEWRTPNSLVFRINGRGAISHVHIESATRLWRADASVIGRVDTVAGRVHPIEIPSTGAHAWSIAYDPKGNDGGGSYRAVFDGVSAVCNLQPGHKADGATFDRFGLLNVVKSVDGAGEIWIDNVVINGKPESFDADPGWEGRRNQVKYKSEEVRPRFNFGYSPTVLAGGKVPGEVGGLFFRGDCRSQNTLACSGDRLDTLTLDKPLRASGRVVLLRAVSDSTTLFGFYHAEHSMRVTDSQASALPRDFLGVSVEGPSGEGFYVYPSYRVHDGEQGSGYPDSPPHIFPDGTVHTWVMEYLPGDPGKISVTLDDSRAEMPVPREHQAAGTQFNRFGFVTPWVDGNGQRIFLDDLEYTCRQE
jgi:hypothetical protein